MNLEDVEDTIQIGALQILIEGYCRFCKDYPYDKPECCEKCGISWIKQDIDTQKQLFFGYGARTAAMLLRTPLGLREYTDEVVARVDAVTESVAEEQKEEQEEQAEQTQEEQNGN